MPVPTAERDAAVRAALGAWFAAHARDLPWRRGRTPYAVWVSEIMLQQTRVDTVVPYFERFLARFPDARALADAPLDAVLASWSGLGYYRRARQLHLAAREVVERYGGLVPAELDDLRSLPGVGPYTAGAIASIAHGRRAALVDGNVARVIARLEAIEGPIKRPATLRRVGSVAERLLPDDTGAGAFNEALMELGALVCTPVEPHCDACPVAKLCEARAKGLERTLPITEARATVPVVAAVAVVLVAPDGRVLLARRAPEGLFGGLWEPPMVEGVTSVAAAKKRLAAIGVPLGSPVRKAGEVTQTLSHRRMQVRVAVGVGDPADEPRIAPRASPYDGAAWLPASSPGVGVSTLARRVLALGMSEGFGEPRPGSPTRPTHQKN